MPGKNSAIVYHFKALWFYTKSRNGVFGRLYVIPKLR